MTTQTLAPIIGSSPAITKAVELIDRYASTALPILLVGATGTGKELFAKRVHARSGRGGRFVPVNCAALPREMAESLLFGHRRGAFSGAIESRQGKVAQANNGTLFLDEVHCLPHDCQAKLLRALDTGEVQPLGEYCERFIDFHVVAAAQEGLWTDVQTGAFRLDLYQRLAGVLVKLPALAERPEDIVPIASHFAGLSGRALEPGASKVLAGHHWPGNVRELRQVIERAGRLVENGTLPPAAITEAIHLGARLDRRRTTELTKSREEWLAIALAHDWDVERMAEAIGLRRTQLYVRLKASGTSLRDLRKFGMSAGCPPDKPDIRSAAFS